MESIRLNSQHMFGISKIKIVKVKEYQIDIILVGEDQRNATISLWGTNESVAYSPIEIDLLELCKTLTFTNISGEK